MTEPSYRLQQLSILVVDDQDPMRKSLQRIVKGMGFGEVYDCHDGESAIELLKSKPIDFIISDLYMRRVNGFDLIQYVRTRDMLSDIPIILVTGEGNQQDIVRAADKGANDYLLKPFQTSELEKKINKALEQYFVPSDFLKNLRTAEREFLRGDSQTAKVFFEKARSIEPNSARAAHGLALTLLALSLDEEACSLLETSISLNPNYFKSYSTLADLNLKHGRNQEALQYMLKELQINPKQVPRQVQAAHLLLKLGHPKEAIYHYREALKEDPRRQNALMGMGHALTNLGKLDKALYYFRRLRRHYPDNTKALEAAIRACISKNDWRKAELFLREAKSNHPKNIDSYQMLASLYFKQNKFEAALELGKEMQAKGLDPIVTLQIKSTALLGANDEDQAYETLHELAELAPSFRTHQQIALILLKKNRTQEAEKAILKALEIQPTNPQSLMILADLKMVDRGWAQAIFLFRKGQSLGADKDYCFSKISECMQYLRMRRERQGHRSIAS